MKKDPFRTLDDPPGLPMPSVETGGTAPAAPHGPRSRLRICRPTVIYSLDPRPNLWYRFWIRVLLGWKWEEL